jgi:hypothetical protein
MNKRPQVGTSGTEHRVGSSAVVEVQNRSVQVLSNRLGGSESEDNGVGHDVEMAVKPSCNVSMVFGEVCSLTVVGVQRARDVKGVRDTESAQTEVLSGACEKLCGGQECTKAGVGHQCGWLEDTGDSVGCHRDMTSRNNSSLLWVLIVTWLLESAVLFGGNVVV